MKRHLILAALFCWSLFPTPGQETTDHDPSQNRAAGGDGGSGSAYRGDMTGVSPPQLLHRVDPYYSEEARNARLEGRVELYIEVGLDGRAHNLKIRRSLGLGLDERAIEAVRQWTFKPAMKDGQPVQVGAMVNVIFRFLPGPVRPLQMPPPDAPLSAQASLTVTSIPSGAVIEINGKFAGSTPSVVKINPGTYKIVLTRSGFRNWERQIDAGTGASLSIDARMEDAESPNVIVIRPDKSP